MEKQITEYKSRVHLFWTGGQSAAPCRHPKPAHNSSKDDYANGPYSLLFSQEWAKGSMWKEQLFPTHVENKPRERKEGTWTGDGNTDPYTRPGFCSLALKSAGNGHNSTVISSAESGQWGSEPELRAQEMGSSHAATSPEFQPGTKQLEAGPSPWVVTHHSSGNDAATQCFTRTSLLFLHKMPFTSPK